jgi:hypothetical protein
MAVEMNPRLWGPVDLIVGGNMDAVSMLPNGGYVVASKSDGRISLQMYSGNGDRGETFVVDAPSNGTYAQWQPDIFTNPDGTFVVTWSEAVSGGDGGRVLRSQLFGINGQALSGAQTLSQAAQGGGVTVASNGNNGLTTAYIKNTGAEKKLTLIEQAGANTTETVLSIVASSGKIGFDWLGADAGYAASYLSDTSLRISVVKNGVVHTYGTAIASITESELVALRDAEGNLTGKFAVTYVADYTYQVTVATFHLDTTTNQIVQDTSVPLTPVTTDSGGPDPFKTSITALRKGGYAIAHKGTAPDGDQRSEIFVTVFDAEGTKGPAIRIPVDGHQGVPAISEMADGRLAVTWHDRSIGSEGSIETVIVDARATAVALTGTDGNDIYAPSKHEGDNFDGKAGFDTLTFKESLAGVNVDLVAGKGFAGDAAGDTYTNFEKVIGSAYNDTITGSAGHVLVGGAGDDTYYVSAFETAIDESGGGSDQVFSSATYTLSAGI